MEDHVATDNLARLKELLEKLFQFGSADLDFGIQVRLTYQWEVKNLPGNRIM